MADPIIPGGIRVQHVMPAKSGLPEDRFITTWAFKTLDGLPPTAAHLASAADVVTAFFNTVTAPATVGITAHLSRYINGPAVECRVYRLGDSVPREPTVFPRPLIISSTSQGPSEVALCASFYATRNLPRRRGRVYVGPLGNTTTSIDQGDGTQPTRPSLSLRNSLIGAMTGLRTQAAAAGIPWGVLSGLDVEIRPVTAGWVDNAFDTQRRRGEEASSRLTWAAPVV